MTSTELKNINPFGHDESVEFPHRVEKEKNWTEHYFFQGYDFDREYGVCIHMGRLVDDPEIWRPTIQVYLPSEELLVTTLWGRNGHPFGPGASPLKISCIEPLRYWSIEYDGVGQRVTRQELMADIIQDAPVEPIRFHLLFEAAGPVYGRSQDMPEGRSVGNFHTEQIMKMRGHFHHRGKVFTVKGYGARDHSAGPRDYGPVIGDIWFQSQYENGDCLMVQIVRFTEAEVRSSYYYRADSGKLEIVEVLRAPLRRFEGSAAWQHQPRPAGRRINPQFRDQVPDCEWRSAAREGPTRYTATPLPTCRRWKS